MDGSLDLQRTGMAGGSGLLLLGKNSGIIILDNKPREGAYFFPPICKPNLETRFGDVVTMAPWVVRGWNLTHFFAMKTVFISYAPFVTLQDHDLLFRCHFGTIVRIVDLNAENHH